MATPLNKDRLAEAIENDGYVRKLVKLFNLCEDLNNLEGLHCLYDIVKNIFLINKNALFEMLFAGKYKLTKIIYKLLILIKLFYFYFR